MDLRLIYLIYYHFNFIDEKFGFFKPEVMPANPSGLGGRDGAVGLEIGKDNFGNDIFGIAVTVGKFGADIFGIVGIVGTEGG